ncbi:cyclin-like protein [Leucosporidium creatinivorum]|uniref:Cyclin-like protein n=1 Tax=Leucosporidium creatinivorum TaxID=106004 RepID=A0A1Y2ECL2_9BASI|nr:cyclin-like protein [Leucosporidium creatinivorum]
MQNLLELEYREDVKGYMFEMEGKTTASVDLIDQQPELQWYMRPYLVDFLIEIHQQHRLRPETLYLALNIVDRYVSKRIVFKKHYQLVGCAALWIAAKFEDAKDRVPTVPELCQMCCGAYDESAFIQMEGHVLSTINWVIGHPTTESWLRLACVTGPMEEQRTQHVARFIMEITLFHKEYIPFKPSELALASLLLARFMLGKSRRILDESEPVLRIAAMLDQHLAEHLDAVSPIVVKKYSFPFYSRASTFVREWFLSGRRFSYYDWSHPTTPARGLKHSPAAPSSVALVSSSPATSSSRSSSSSDDSCDEDDPCEPHTPLTPLPPYSTSDPFTASSVPRGKENPPRPPKSMLSSREAVMQLPAVRPPLNRASWEMNSSPAVPLYRP